MKNKSKVLERCPGIGLEVKEHPLSNDARAGHQHYLIKVQCPDCLKFPLKPIGMVGSKFGVPTHGIYIFLH